MDSTPSDLPLGLSQTTWLIIGAVLVVLVIIVVYVMFSGDDKAAEKKESMSDSDKAMLRRMVDMNKQMMPRNSMAAVREGMVDPVLVAAAMRS